MPIKYVEDKVTFDEFIVSQFARLFLGFSKGYNAKHKRAGNLFQKKFKRIEQKTIERLVSRICYVHHNPIHHDAVSFYDAAFFSSFNSFLSSGKTNIAKAHTFSIFNQLSAITSNIDYKKPFETGIFEYPTTLNGTDITHFLCLHALFHKEWLEKKNWEDLDGFHAT